MSDPTLQRAGPDDPEEDEEGNPLDAVIYAFLKANPQPTDEQLHTVAELLGFEFEVFEERVFELFGEQLEGLDGEDVDELADDDPLSTFLLSFFMLNPEPTEEQIHSLADLANVTPEELEQKVYALLAELGDDEEEGEDDDEDLDEEAEDEEPEEGDDDLDEDQPEDTDPETKE